ncbi:hypothetical protein FH972_027063 [Carpinus fangiana]|uniref:Uncharacterized protein n=1 Tax=Carpinus fangiana TaxID=176857 RepID=A0A5N6L631_9ROSI|nr:hypothetical protein FH972_027063 [Carpinus fangiana]
MIDLFWVPIKLELDPESYINPKSQREKGRRVGSERDAAAARERPGKRGTAARKREMETERWVRIRGREEMREIEMPWPYRSVNGDDGYGSVGGRRC